MTTTTGSGCRENCLLDCPYCHRHVIDVYGHLKFDPCAQARDAS